MKIAYSRKIPKILNPDIDFWISEVSILKKSKNTWSRYRTSKQVKKACIRKNPKILELGIRLQNRCNYHAQEKIPKILDPDIRLQNKWNGHPLEKFQKYLIQT